MTNSIIKVFSLAIFGIFIFTGQAHAGVPTVVSASVTSPTQITIVYSEEVITGGPEYTDLNFSSTQCGSYPVTVIGVGGSGTDTITLYLDNSLCADAAGTLDIVVPPGVASVSTLEFIIPVDDQIVTDGQRPLTMPTSCGGYSFLSPLVSDITFSEDVTGFEATDILVGNGIVTDFTELTSSVYSIEITAVVSGPVIISVNDGVANDMVGLPNYGFGCAVSFDIIPPTLLSAVITGLDTVTLTYSEPVYSNINDYSDLAGDLAGQSVSGINPTLGFSNTYLLTLDIGLLPTSAIGMIDVSSLGGIFDGVYDASGNFLVPLNDFPVTDGQAPTVVISTTEPDPTTTNPIPIILTFSEDVTGVDLDYLLGWWFDNGYTSNLSGGPAVYTFDAYPQMENFVTLHYMERRAQDSAGNFNPGSNNFIVFYDDDTPPIITLLGDDPVTVSFGASYTDAGATALDDTDGDITASIITNNPVNTGVTGTYNITYDVSDIAGNVATQVNRTVVVNPPSPPIGGGGGGGSVILLDACENIPDMQSDTLSSYVFYNNKCLTPEEYEAEINPKPAEPIEEISERTGNKKENPKITLETAESFQSSVPVITEPVIEEIEEEVTATSFQRIPSQVATVAEAGIIKEKTFLNKIFKSIGNFFSLRWLAVNK